MKARLIWGNLVSSDIKRTAGFYTALGFKQYGEMNNESVSFFFGGNDFIINFFTAERLSKPINGSLSASTGSNEIIFSLSVDHKDDVEHWAEKVQRAGGAIFSLPQNYDQGYTFGFADPDNHKFNVLYWPGM